MKGERETRKGKDIYDEMLKKFAEEIDAVKRLAEMMLWTVIGREKGEKKVRKREKRERG
jgi:hypothetical protein